MVGKGRPGVLSVWSPDPVLSVLAPLALATAAGTGLVIDRAGGLTLGSRRTVADLAEEGARLDELSPGRAGVAVMQAGPVGEDDFNSVVDRLAGNWPAIVIRVADQQQRARTVPVIPLFPGWLEPSPPGAAVWQPVVGAGKPPGPGPVLPRLPSRIARSLLSGRMPARSRWISGWTPVWGLPWA